MAPASLEVKNTYNEGLIEFEDGNYKKTLQLMQKIINQPLNDFTDNAHILSAKSYMKLKSFQQASQSLNIVLKSPYISDRNTEARLLASYCLVSLKQNSKAESLIRESITDQLSLQEKAQFYELLLPLLDSKGAQLEQLETLAFLSQHHPNSLVRKEYRERAGHLIESTQSEEGLKALSDNRDLGEFRVEAMFQYAMEQIEKNELRAAETYLRRIRTISPNSYLGLQARSLINQIRSRGTVSTKSIGIVLPLTGNYSRIGQQVLKGIQLSLGVLGTQSSHGVELVIKDSEGSPELAAKKVAELSQEHKVIAIVGGLLSKTALQEVTKAQELGTPFVALSQSESLIKNNPFAFQSATTAKTQVKTLVNKSMNELGLKRFGILYPNDRYGVEFANYFWDEVEKNGGSVTAAQIYQPGETDFKDHVKRLAGTYYLEDRKKEYKQLLRDWRRKNKSRRARPPADLLPPKVQFEALFIPDSPKALGQIAPMLAFHNVNSIQLLGTNLWNSPDFIRRGQQFVSKSLFQDVFLGHSENYRASQFYQNYVQQFQSAPGLFAIQGFDAGKLILSTIKMEPQNRIDFIRLFSGNAPVKGATASISMGENHQLQRPLVSLTVSDGTITLYQ